MNDTAAITDSKLLTENEEREKKDLKWHVDEQEIEDEKLQLWGGQQLGSDLSDWRGSN